MRDLHAQYPTHSTTIPAESGSQDAAAPIYIPPNLVPVLALLRDHIQELTRDNAALRYTFLGSATRPAGNLSPGSSIATTPLSVDSPPLAEGASMPLALPVPGAGGSLAPPPAGGADTPGVDLSAVVERVRTLILENDELGDMVAEAGRVDGEEWLRTLEGEKALWRRFRLETVYMTC